MKIRILVFAVMVLIVGCKKSESQQQQPTNKPEIMKVETTKYVPDTDSLYVAVVKTNLGTFELLMFHDKAPVTVENFVGLARKGYYNNVTFHRIIKGFVIQGGDPTGTGMGGDSFFGKEFKDEFHPDLRHDGFGILSMANRGPATNTSQFFITLGATPHLDNRHSVFGRVYAGVDVVEKIGSVKTGQMDKPVEPVVMENVTIEVRPNKLKKK